jgi:uncharacterized RDD family membrane protein YckC
MTAIKNNITIHLTNAMQNIKTEPNIGNRLVAGLVDYIIIYGFTFFLIFTIGEPNDEGGYSLNGLPAFIPIIFWLIMTVGLETVLGGTIGNLLVGLKAITLNGTNRKLTFKESFKRHLLDPIDMFFFGLAGIITIKNTENNQRLGDLWAKTIVVPIKYLTEIKTHENNA